MTTTRSRWATCGWLAGIGLVLAGCGDDEEATPDVAVQDAAVPDAGEDAGVVVCPTRAPRPSSQTGACCWRASNASQLNAPELRVSGLRVRSPTSLGTPTMELVIAASLDDEHTNWLVRVAGAPTTGTGSVNVETGQGTRDGTGTFAFAAESAPGPGAASRWDRQLLAGGLDGQTLSTSAASGLVTVPIYGMVASGGGGQYCPGPPPDDAGNAQVLMELPLRALEITSATMSYDRSCIGTRGSTSYDTSAGHLRAFLSVEDTRALTAVLGPFEESSVCMLLAGMPTTPGNCGDMPQEAWTVKPDSFCNADGCLASSVDPAACNPDSTCNAWELRADFAAQGVEITN